MILHAHNYICTALNAAENLPLNWGNIKRRTFELNEASEQPIWTLNAANGTQLLTKANFSDLIGSEDFWV